MWKLLVAILVSVSLGCVTVPAINRPTTSVIHTLKPLPEISLIDKALLWNSVITFQFLNKEEHLIYRILFPLEENYLASHDLENMALYHGYWLSALALHLSTIPNPETARLLNKGLKALRIHFKASGEQGKLVRAYVPSLSQKPLEWMDESWEKGEGGYWIRDGATAEDYDGPIFALALITSLHKNGSVTLDPETVDLVKQTLVDLSAYFAPDDWRLNGLSALRRMALLLACSEFNEKCLLEFDRLTFQRAHGSAAADIRALQALYQTVGRENAEISYRVDNAIYSHVLALHLLDFNHPEIREAMDELWATFEPTSNPFFAFVQGITSDINLDSLDEAVTALQMYPEDKIRITDLIEIETASIQPLPNRPPVPHYWAESYFRQATKAVTSYETNEYLAGQDYLVALWLGVRYGLITQEKMREVPKWSEK